MLTNFLFVCVHALESLHIVTCSGDKDVPKSVKHVQSFCFAHKTSNILFVVVVTLTFSLAVYTPIKQGNSFTVCTAVNPLQKKYNRHFIHHFHISHNTPCLPPKILHNLCFSFFLGITSIPRIRENNFVVAWFQLTKTVILNGGNWHGVRIVQCWPVLIGWYSGLY